MDVLKVKYETVQTLIVGHYATDTFTVFILDLISVPY